VTSIHYSGLVQTTDLNDFYANHETI